MAILEIEIGNRWLEFTRDDEMVCIKVAVDSFKGNHPLLVIEPRNTFSYVEEKGSIVQWSYFYSLIITKLNSFLQDIEKINPRVLETKIIKDIIARKSCV